MRLKLCSSIYSFDRILTAVGLGTTRVDLGQTDASICGVSQVAGIGAYKNNKKSLQRSFETSAEKWRKFCREVGRLLCRCYAVSCAAIRSRAAR